MMRKLLYFILFVGICNSCKTPIKIKSIQGYVFKNKMDPAKDVQMYEPLKSGQFSWTYNGLNVLNQNGFYNIKNVDPKKLDFYELNKSKDSLTFYLFFTQNKDIDLSSTKEFPKEYKFKVKVDSIIRMDTIFFDEPQIKY